MVETNGIEGLLLREDSEYFTASELHSLHKEENLNLKTFPIIANWYSNSLALCNGVMDVLSPTQP